jgi:predicted acyl esterase
MRRIAAVLALLIGLVPIVLSLPAHGDSATTGFHWNDITSTDGVVLKSNVIAPAASGRHPGIVLIASWALNDFQYLAQARQLAGVGYVALSYTPRGFWLSGGTIQVAGPEDMADLSTVVDWMVANTSVDPRHVGVVGMSYGAGIGLLATAHEARIRAVASLSGWADMCASMYGDHTRRPQAAWALETFARAFGRPGDEMNRILRDYWADRGAEYRQQWCRTRSPAFQLDAINRNHPAVFIGHSFGDSIFPVNQMVDFYGRLTGPRRLELAPGDHLTVEASGLAGVPNHVWTSVHRWFDRYLRGVDSGIDAEPPVVVRPRNSDAVESYADWAAATGHVRRTGLGWTPGWELSGELGAAPAGGWSHTIGSGVDTPADGGVALLSNGFESLTGIPPTVVLRSVSRWDAGVWVSEPFAAGAAVRGVAHLHLVVTSAAPHGTVIAYLYDLDGRGVGRLITHAPYSWLAGGGLPVDVALPAAGYDVPAGHRLALVVDTRDPLYFDANTSGAPMTFTGESWLDVPLR